MPLIRVIADPDDDANFQVWIGLEGPHYNAEDFISQPYSFIIGQGPAEALALDAARTHLARAFLSVKRLDNI